VTIEKTDTGWSLLQGRGAITRVCIGRELVIRIEGEAPGTELYELEVGALQLITNGTVETFDARHDSPAQLGKLVELRSKRVVEWQVQDGGRCVVSLEANQQLIAKPKMDVEAWQISSEDGLIVALPGGGVSIWGESP
jgi:hypothetical protein